MARVFAASSSMHPADLTRNLSGIVLETGAWTQKARGLNVDRYNEAKTSIGNVSFKCRDMLFHLVLYGVLLVASYLLVKR